MKLTPSQKKTLLAIHDAGGIVGIWLNATRAIGANMNSCDALLSRGLLEKGTTDGKRYFLMTGAGYTWLDNHK